MSTYRLLVFKNVEFPFISRRGEHYIVLDDVVTKLFPESPALGFISNILKKRGVPMKNVSEVEVEALNRTLRIQGAKRQYNLNDVIISVKALKKCYAFVRLHYTSLLRTIRDGDRGKSAASSSCQKCRSAPVVIILDDDDDDNGVARNQTNSMCGSQDEVRQTESATQPLMVIARKPGEDESSVESSGENTGTAKRNSTVVSAEKTDQQAGETDLPNTGNSNDVIEINKDLRNSLTQVDSHCPSKKRKNNLHKRQSSSSTTEERTTGMSPHFSPPLKGMPTVSKVPENENLPNGGSVVCRIGESKGPSTALKRNRRIEKGGLFSSLSKSVNCRVSKDAPRAVDEDIEEICKEANITVVETGENDSKMDQSEMGDPAKGRSQNTEVVQKTGKLVKTSPVRSHDYAIVNSQKIQCVAKIVLQKLEDIANRKRITLEKRGGVLTTLTVKAQDFVETCDNNKGVTWRKSGKTQERCEKIRQDAQDVEPARSQVVAGTDLKKVKTKPRTTLDIAKRGKFTNRDIQRSQSPADINFQKTQESFENDTTTSANDAEITQDVGSCDVPMEKTGIAVASDKEETQDANAEKEEPVEKRQDHVDEGLSIERTQNNIENNDPENCEDDAMTKDSEKSKDFSNSSPKESADISKTDSERRKSISRSESKKEERAKAVFQNLQNFVDQFLIDKESDTIVREKHVEELASRRLSEDGVSSPAGRDRTEVTSPVNHSGQFTTSHEDTRAPAAADEPMQTEELSGTLILSCEDAHEPDSSDESSVHSNVTSPSSCTAEKDIGKIATEDSDGESASVPERQSVNHQQPDLPHEGPASPPAEEQTFDPSTAVVPVALTATASTEIEPSTVTGVESSLNNDGNKEKSAVSIDSVETGDASVDTCDSGSRVTPLSASQQPYGESQLDANICPQSTSPLQARNAESNVPQSAVSGQVDETVEPAAVDRHTPNEQLDRSSPTGYWKAVNVKIEPSESECGSKPKKRKVYVPMKSLDSVAKILTEKQQAGGEGNDKTCGVGECDKTNRRKRKTTERVVGIVDSESSKRPMLDEDITTTEDSSESHVEAEDDTSSVGSPGSDTSELDSELEKIPTVTLLSGLRYASASDVHQTLFSQNCTFKVFLDLLHALEVPMNDDIRELPADNMIELTQIRESVPRLRYILENVEQHEVCAPGGQSPTDAHENPAADSSRTEQDEEQELLDWSKLTNLPPKLMHKLRDRLARNKSESKQMPLHFTYSSQYINNAGRLSVMESGDEQRRQQITYVDPRNREQMRVTPPANQQHDMARTVPPQPQQGDGLGRSWPPNPGATLTDHNYREQQASVWRPLVDHGQSQGQGQNHHKSALQQHAVRRPADELQGGRLQAGFRPPVPPPGMFPRLQRGFPGGNHPWFPLPSQHPAAVAPSGYRAPPPHPTLPNQPWPQHEAFRERPPYNHQPPMILVGPFDAQTGELLSPASAAPGQPGNYNPQHVYRMHHPFGNPYGNIPRPPPPPPPPGSLNAPTGQVYGYRRQLPPTTADNVAPAWQGNTYNTIRYGHQFAQYPTDSRWQHRAHAPNPRHPTSSARESAVYQDRRSTYTVHHTCTSGPGNAGNPDQQISPATRVGGNQGNCGANRQYSEPAQQNRKRHSSDGVVSHAGRAPPLPYRPHSEASVQQKPSESGIKIDFVCSLSPMVPGSGGQVCGSVLEPTRVDSHATSIGGASESTTRQGQGTSRSAASTVTTSAHQNRICSLTRENPVLCKLLQEYDDSRASRSTAEVVSRCKANGRAASTGSGEGPSADGSTQGAVPSHEAPTLPRVSNAVEQSAVTRPGGTTKHREAGQRPPADGLQGFEPRVVSEPRESYSNNTQPQSENTRAFESSTSASLKSNAAVAPPSDSSHSGLKIDFVCSLRDMFKEGKQGDITLPYHSTTSGTADQSVNVAPERNIPVNDGIYKKQTDTGSESACDPTRYTGPRIESVWSLSSAVQSVSAPANESNNRPPEEFQHLGALANPGVNASATSPANMSDSTSAMLRQSTKQNILSRQAVAHSTAGVVSRSPAGLPTPSYATSMLPPRSAEDGQTGLSTLQQLRRVTDQILPVTGHTRQFAVPGVHEGFVNSPMPPPSVCTNSNTNSATAVTRAEQLVHTNWQPADGKKPGPTHTIGTNTFKNVVNRAANVQPVVNKSSLQTDVPGLGKVKFHDLLQETIMKCSAHIERSRRLKKRANSQGKR